MRAAGKTAIVAAGYAFALAAAFAAERIYVAATPHVDRQAYAGMTAFGDAAVFVGALGLAALPASAAALWFLRGWRPFWPALATFACAWTALAFVAIVPWVARLPAAGVWLGLAPIRALAAPLFALGAAVAALIAPSREVRIALWAVAAGEGAAFLIALIFLRSG